MFNYIPRKDTLRNYHNLKGELISKTKKQQNISLRKLLCEEALESWTFLISLLKQDEG